MIYSWIVAITYTLIYSICIFFTKYKAQHRLNIHRGRRSTVKKGLIAHQQNLTPNADKITELTNGATITNTNTGGHERNSSQQIVDISHIHQQLHHSLPYGAPVSNWECIIAMLHSLDAGLHLGLLVEMIRDSQGWNLQEQYLLICIFLLLLYRIVSFYTVYSSLPRYSYSKNIKQSKENVDVLDNDNATNVVSSPSSPGFNDLSSDQIQRRTSDIIQQQQSRSCLSYCWLQFFFDFGYIMELAPWLWNWEQTKIILPEFAWFSKMRTLLQSFPFSILMVVSLLAIDNVSQHIHFYFIVSLFVSIVTIVLSLTLYDHRTLNRDVDEKVSTTILYFCNFCYRLFSTIARIVILSFLIALFPWYLLFAILLIPIIAYSGPYKLGNTDAEPLNLIYQSLLVFPDYSAPFGKIPDSETYLNNIHRVHLAIIILFGAPLIFIFIIVEKIVNKLLKIDNEIISMNKEKYASFRITTYTLSRFVESSIELSIIAAELYSPFFHSQLLIRDAALVHGLFWLCVAFTVLAPIPFYKLYDEFVVDNEEDYELWYGVGGGADGQNGNDGTNGGQNGKGGADGDYIMSNEQYNQQHNFTDVGNGLSPNNHHPQNSTMNAAAMTGMIGSNNISSVTQGINGQIDIRGSRQYLRQKQYWIAVHRNNYKELAWVLRSRQHVNLLEYNEQEQLGIVIVALRHDWDCLKLLVKHGGGLRHLVRYAALHGQVEILKYLHEKLQINMAEILDNADEALLFSAIEGAQPKVVQLLIEYGADLTAPSTEGESPIILAAKKGELEILKLFGNNGVDLQVLDENDNTVAHYAAQVFNGKHILTYLDKLYGKGSSSGTNGHHHQQEQKEYGDTSTSGFNFNFKNKRGATAAYNASWKGQIDNLEVLKEVGADFTISNNDGNNCLIAASMNDQPMIINYLLDECKLDVDFGNLCQETALYWAASNGSIGCVEQLIAHKANLEKCDKYGITPLMVAAEHGEAKAVEVLLEAGANSNHQNQDGETALMKACAEGFIDCVKALIKYKTDHSITDEEGNPAILWCCMTGNMEIFRYLVLEALNLTKEDIEQTVNNDKETCIDWIVENKLDIGIEVLKELGIEVTSYLEDDDDDDDDDGWHHDDDDDDDDDY